MVRHSRINPTHVSTGQSSSQETHETAGKGPSQATRGRKSQRQQHEQEEKRELELGRQLNIEETRLLQKVKSSGAKDFRSRAGSHTLKK